MTGLTYLVRPAIGLRRPRVRVRGLIVVENVAVLSDHTELVGSGAVRPIIDRTSPLERAPEALARIGEGHATGTMVVTV